MSEQPTDAGRRDEDRGHTATTAEEAMATAAADAAHPADAADSGDAGTDPGTTGEQAYAPHPAPDDPRRSGGADAPTDLGRDARPDSTPSRDRMAAESP